MAKKYLSKISKDGTTIYVKDEEAREAIASSTNASYVPTLALAPTSSTTTYIKDGQTVSFEIGQYARVADAMADTGYKFFQLYDLEDGAAKWNPVIVASMVWEDITTPPQGYDVWIDSSNSGGSVLKIKNKTTGQWEGITTIKGDPSSADINLDGSVITVTNNAGESSSIDVLSSTDERVQIVVTVDDDAPQGTVAIGLVVNAYYNDADAPSASVTTDSNGMAVLRVPNGYKYRLAFPQQQGCRDIADIVHTASVSQRSVEVEYQEEASPEEEGELVNVAVKNRNNNSVTPYSGIVVSLTYDGTTEQQTTDSTGNAKFRVPFGKQYTVSVPAIQGKYIPQNTYDRTFTASKSIRLTVYEYRPYTSGLFIVDDDGGEYTLDQWEAAVQEGTKENSEAKLIAVKTSALIGAGGTLALDIDMLRDRSYGTTCMWASSAVQFYSIPLNGNSSTAAYYYDGLTASRLVQEEGDDMNVGTPAADRALAMSRTVAEGTERERSLPGFIGSVGQWTQVWNNRFEIDDILLSVRPEGAYLFSSLTANKWTITQNNATNVWRWAGALSSSNKNTTAVALPFFAY